MKQTVLVYCIFFCFHASAQDSIKNLKAIKPVFQSINQAGFVMGESKPAYEIQSINGFKYKTFFAGVGIGIDNYLFRSVPLFIDVRKDLLNKLNTPFIFADAGGQLSWVPSDQKVLSYYDQGYNGKLYFNAGAGYKINILRRNALVLSAAFSLKKINVDVYAINRNGDPVCDYSACQEQKPDIDKYTLRRLSLMIGWTIW